MPPPKPGTSSSSASAKTKSTPGAEDGDEDDEDEDEGLGATAGDDDLPPGFSNEEMAFLAKRVVQLLRQELVFERERLARRMRR